MKSDKDSDVVTASWPKNLGEGLESNLDRAFALVDDTNGKQPRMEIEVYAFIRRPELREVANSVMKLAPSFSRASALRKILEADEAIQRALAIDIAARDHQIDEQIAEAKKVNGEG